MEFEVCKMYMHAVPATVRDLVYYLASRVPFLVHCCTLLSADRLMSPDF